MSEDVNNNQTNESQTLDTTNLTDVTDNIQYVYISIPKEYMCVYHKILAMMADYGVSMLKDCKASCDSVNQDIIECFNMFNAAVAAHKLEQDSLANTLINYVKTKINQIYKGRDNSSDFIFPVDENGELHAIVSCDDTVRFYINPEDGELFSRIFKTDGGIQQQFILGTEDEPEYEIDEPQGKPFDYNIEVYVDDTYLPDDSVDPYTKTLYIEIYDIVDIDGVPIYYNDITYFVTLNDNYYEGDYNYEGIIIPIYNGTKDMNIVVYHENRGVIHTIPISIS